MSSPRRDWVNKDYLGDPIDGECTYDPLGPIPHGSKKYPHQRDHLPRRRDHGWAIVAAALVLVLTAIVLQHLL